MYASALNICVRALGGQSPDPNDLPKRQIFQLLLCTPGEGIEFPGRAFAEVERVGRMVSLTVQGSLV